MNNKSEDKEELVDVYDENGKYIRSMYKYEKLEKNEWLKCCTCFVMDQNYDLIMQVRSKNKIKEPSKLDLCSGHVKKNEVYTQAMIREMEEEIGIDVEESINSINTGNMCRLGNIKRDFTEIGGNYRCLTDIFVIFRNELGTDGLNFQWDEIEKILIMNKEDVIEMIRNSKTRFPYNEDCEKIFDRLNQKIQEHEIQEKTQEEIEL